MFLPGYVKRMMFGRNVFTRAEARDYIGVRLVSKM